MNLKKAKLIRALVKELVKKEVIKGPWAQYGVITHSKEFPTGKFDGTGDPIIERHDARQIVLNPVCPKGVYHRMKKTSMAAVLAGQG